MSSEINGISGAPRQVGNTLQRYRAASANLLMLMERWPKCFAPNPAKRRPLKIGIRHEIIALGVLNSKEVKDALGGYCDQISYYRKFVEGAQRVDLEGNDAGAITAGDVIHGRYQIARLVAKRKAFKGRTKAKPPQPAAEPAPRLGLADLKAAAIARRNGDQA